MAFRERADSCAFCPRSGIASLLSSFPLGFSKFLNKVSCPVMATWKPRGRLGSRFFNNKCVFAKNSPFVHTGTLN